MIPAVMVPHLLSCRLLQKEEEEIHHSNGNAAHCICAHPHIWPRGDNQDAEHHCWGLLPRSHCEWRFNTADLLFMQSEVGGKWVIATSFSRSWTLKKIITESLWWVDFPHIHYLASLSLEAEWSKVSQPINVFSSQYSGFSIASPLSATFSRILPLTLTFVSSEDVAQHDNFWSDKSTDRSPDLSK